jgi:hypothetical protein
MANKFSIDIQTADDAFQDDRAAELARILREFADQLEACSLPHDGAILDINGNTCGFYKGAF